MSVVGGLRDRLIIENIRWLIEENLRLLGWYEENNTLIDYSITVRSSPVEDDEELLPNIVAVSTEGTTSDYLELGSDLEEFTWNFYIDIYAEDHASGLHLCGDIKAIIGGKLPSIGRLGKTLDIYDLTMATPPVLFRVEVDKIESQRSRVYNKAFQKFWWVVGFQLTDSYLNDLD